MSEKVVNEIDNLHRIARTTLGGITLTYINPDYVVALEEENEQLRETINNINNLLGKKDQPKGWAAT